MGLVVLTDLLVASASGDDLARGDEQIAGVNRRDQQSTGVVAEIEDQSPHPAGQQASHRLLQFVGGMLPETADPHVADPRIAIQGEIPRAVALSAVALDGLHLDLRPDDAEVHRLALSLMLNRKYDGLSDRSLDEIADGVHVESLGALSVDLQQPVAGADAGLFGRAPGMVRATVICCESGSSTNSIPTPLNSCFNSSSIPEETLGGR